jgi:protein arginine kinase activator
MEQGLPAETGDPNEACPECGLTRRELYAQGQMGCARCYQVFGAEVERALLEIHGKSVHIGKVWEAPGHSG